METLERAIVWRNLLTGGNEYFELRRRGNSHILRGKVVSIVEPAEPLFISYEVICDERWHTRQARDPAQRWNDENTLQIEVSGTSWMVNGKHLHELQGASISI